MVVTDRAVACIDALERIATAAADKACRYAISSNRITADGARVQHEVVDRLNATAERVAIRGNRVCIDRGEGGTDIAEDVPGRYAATARITVVRRGHVVRDQRM